MSDFLAYGLKSISRSIKPKLEDLFDTTPGEFDDFNDVFALFEKGLPVPRSLLEGITENIPAPLLKEIFRTDGERFLRFPTPQLIHGMFFLYYVFFVVVCCLFKVETRFVSCSPLQCIFFFFFF